MRPCHSLPLFHSHIPHLLYDNVGEYTNSNLCIMQMRTLLDTISTDGRLDRFQISGINETASKDWVLTTNLVNRAGRELVRDGAIQRMHQKLSFAVASGSTSAAVALSTATGTILRDTVVCCAKAFETAFLRSLMYQKKQGFYHVQFRERQLSIQRAQY